MTPQRYRRIRAVLDRRQPDLTVLMDHVNKPHNLSAILRSCDAVGVLRAHVVTPQRYLKAHRASSASSSKWVELRAHKDLGEALAELRGQGMQIAAAHGSERSVDFRALDYCRPTAVVMGAELSGPSPEVLEAADAHLTVPMVGMVESLNVSVAAALILYEAQRQRQAAGMYEGPRLDVDTYWRTVFRWGYPKLARRLEEMGRSYPRLREEDGALLDPPPAGEVPDGQERDGEGGAGQGRGL